MYIYKTRKRENVRKLFKDDHFQSLLGIVVSGAFHFISTLLLARTLTKQAFGEWTLFFEGAYLIELMRCGITQIGLVRFLACSDKEEESKIIGAGWVLSVGFIAIIYLLGYGTICFNRKILDSNFGLLFAWYPLLSIATLPMSVSLAILQAKKMFLEILCIRLINMGSFMLLVFANIFFFGFGVKYIVIMYIGANLLASLFSLFSNYSGVQCLFKTTVNNIKELFQFGKYSMGTLLGSNLLRMFSIFMIGFFMGEDAVAIYSVPLQIYTGFNMVLNGFSAVAFPNLSRISREKNNFKMVDVFYKYSSCTLLVFIPVIIIGFVFARPLIWIIGGEKYIETALSMNILKVFLLACLLLPIDRYLGDILDGINKPKYNFIKVSFMLVFSLAGNLISLFYFKSLLGVGIIMVISIFIGIIAGQIVLKRERFNIRFIGIYRCGKQNITKFFARVQVMLMKKYVN